MTHAAVGATGTGLAYIYWNSGKREAAGDLLAGALEEAKTNMEDGAEDIFTPFNIASIYAVQGEKEQAYTWLLKSIDAGWLNYSALINDPLFECLHDDDRFKQMMADLKARVAEMRARAEEEIP
ncbi:MAG: hypothetical protein ABIJ00_03900 [Candidatus Eisenbacteria bacterium]